MSNDNASEFDSFTPKITELEGQLMLITATEHLSDVETAFGIKDPILADVTVLYPEGPVVYQDMQIFQSRLVMKLKDRVGTGRPYLARIGKGAEYKGNIPWEFRPPTGADQVIARKFMDGEDYTAAAVGALTGSVAATAPAKSVQAAPQVSAAEDDPFAVNP